MSKATLKKELKNFDADQLREILLDLYSARKEAKEYLDFFVDPDIDALLEKTSKEIYKELNRVKHRALTPRWTKIRASIKKVETLKVGPEHVVDLMRQTLLLAIGDYANYYVSDGYGSGMITLLSNTITYGDKNCVLDRVLPDLLKIIDKLSHSKVERHKYLALEMKRLIESFKPSVK